MIDAAICDGDYVVIRQQPDANNGDIVAAMLDGEATVKTFQRKNGQVWLMPHIALGSSRPNPASPAANIPARIPPPLSAPTSPEP